MGIGIKKKRNACLCVLMKTQINHYKRLIKRFTTAAAAAAVYSGTRDDDAGELFISVYITLFL